ncbi:MAG: ROK family protein [Anaerolineales bacterium]|nr:ROK family protein [Anaerolineales bacterium]
MDKQHPGETILAVDIGGTKVAAALITETGEILKRCIEPTCQDGPEAGIEQIVRILWGLQKNPDNSCSRVLAVGVGIPAVLEPVTDHVIWGPNLPGWRNIPLKEELMKKLDLPVAVEYDGHTAVLGEWWKGQGQGVQSLVDIIIGTGIGGGLILDGKLVRGMNRLAGAAGWIAMTSNAHEEQARPEMMGHWEFLAAGPGILLRAKQLAVKYPDSALHGLVFGKKVTTRDIFESARAGELLAAQIVRETAEIIGLGVASIVSLLNPEKVILGGSIGAQGDLLLDDVRSAAAQWAQPVSIGSVEIVSSTLGADAGLLGAAYAAWLRYSTYK